MKASDVYVDLDGNRISLGDLDAEERRLVAGLRRRAQANPGWIDFRNYAVNAVAAFYDARRLPRKKSKNSIPFQIALDLSSRLGIAEGLIRPGDYRDELEDLIHQRFPSRSAFCKATGLSEDLLRHVLAGRKDFSIEKLSKALDRIGYRLRIASAPKWKRTG